MGTISRANVHDVLKNKPRDRVVAVEGKLRTIRRPEGRAVKQYVDKQGNVVWLQLLKFGDNAGQEQIDKAKGQHLRDGFVPYDQCPLRNGAANASPALEEEFAQLPDELRLPCKCDPTIHEKRGRFTHANEPCPHTRWLVSSRRAAEEQARELRATKIETPMTLEKQKLELQANQLAESRETNARLVEIMERLANAGGMLAPAPATEGDDVEAGPSKPKGKNK